MCVCSHPLLVEVSRNVVNTLIPISLFSFIPNEISFLLLTQSENLFPFFQVCAATLVLVAMQKQAVQWCGRKACASLIKTLHQKRSREFSGTVTFQFLHIPEISLTFPFARESHRNHATRGNSNELLTSNIQEDDPMTITLCQQQLHELFN